MSYRGSNPLGQALAHDLDGHIKDRLLAILCRYQDDVTSIVDRASPPAVYERHLGTLNAIELCMQVIQEFHAVCMRAGGERAAASS